MTTTACPVHPAERAWPVCRRCVFVRACNAAADMVEAKALDQMARDLALMTEHSEQQLRLAVKAPDGSLARQWLARLVDEHMERAADDLGREVLWSETREWHLNQRGGPPWQG